MKTSLQVLKESVCLKYLQTHNAILITGPQDYEALTSFQLSFSGNTVRQCINISITDDDTFEVDEVLRIFLNIVSGTGVAIQPTSANITIIDDDSKYVHLFRVSC